jgi:indole-3-glycerol phosphate synthase
VIDRILETKRQELEAMDTGLFGPRRKPVAPLALNGPVNIIAELKRKSPSAGFMGEIDPGRVAVYGRYAKAISVVTDRTYFGGSLQFLAEAAEMTDLPILCKDFIIDRKQIDLAYAAGADLVLLIARILGKENLGTLYSHARGLGLACLVELHDAADIAIIEDLAPPILGVNARDLDTLNMDLEAAAVLLTQIEAPVRVAESGIKSRKDMERMKGANAFLIGETLMRAQDLEATFEELLHGED